jgi:hypothetical protein
MRQSRFGRNRRDFTMRPDVPGPNDIARRSEKGGRAEVQMMEPSRGVRTWPETMRKAEALEAAVRLIDAYRRSDNVSERDLLLDIIAAIETKTGHVFPTNIRVINPDDTKGRA